jgi:hypothetical protein
MEREQAFDLAVTEKLRALQPPAGLREAILAGSRMSRPKPFWRRAQTLAWAASLAIIFGLTATWMVFSPSENTELIAVDVMQEVASTDHAEAMPRAEGVLLTFLNDSSMRLAAGIPFDFNQLKANGCRSLRLGDREMVEVCFERNGSWFHLYVGKRAEFRSAAGPLFHERDSLASVTWTDSRHTYVLVGGEGTDALSNLL